MNPDRKMLINADLGECVGHDKDIIPFIDIASIACGGHAGNHDSMEAAVKLCKLNDVKVGAHPSYPDRKGFGRTSLLTSIPHADIIACCVDQIHQLKSICDSMQIPLSFIKPHGALYHDLNKNRNLSDLFVESCRKIFSRNKPLSNEALEDITFIGGPAGELESACQNDHVDFLAESFADRRYLSNGELAPRSGSLPGVFTQPDDVANQIKLLLHGQVKSIDGQLILLSSKTVCVHGDSPGAIEFAEVVRSCVDQAIAR